MIKGQAHSNQCHKESLAVALFAVTAVCRNFKKVNSLPTHVDKRAIKIMMFRTGHEVHPNVWEPQEVDQNGYLVSAKKFNLWHGVSAHMLETTLISLCVIGA
ncbi:hypothetical protein ZWY2020_048808 [Hordeum vulgare]|nr:hypothetical protein ZWY2020_010305 [Hordeum vulgare]KAI4975201.1 hypothetical protein ZWY2020_048808 [Hordeum vulgare]